MVEQPFILALVFNFSAQIAFLLSVDGLALEIKLAGPIVPSSAYAIRFVFTCHEESSSASSFSHLDFQGCGITSGASYAYLRVIGVESI